MLCCLNPHCDRPENSDNNKFCQRCGTRLVLLRNRYRPTKLLGMGGFGRTYLAQDTDKLNELCVIKQLAPLQQEPLNLEKAQFLFKREAKQLQKLGEHPQIPTLFAYFEEGGHLYLVQQYIEGITLLEELRQQGYFSEDKIHQLLKELLTILAFVHEKNVVHRDIKPDNIMRRHNITATQSSLVLIDFGVAKEFLDTTLVRGTTVGSYGYVAMEQLQYGRSSPAGDLYSLGATCFHLLTNVHPGELWAVKSYSWTQNWQDHLKKPINKPLERILNRLLQFNYEYRYKSVTEVLEDVKDLNIIEEPETVYAFKSKSNRQNNFFQNLAIGLPIVLTISILAIQAYGYWRYHFFPINPIAFVSSLSNRGILLKKTIIAHNDIVTALKTIPEGEILISGSEDSKLKIWNLSTGKLLKTIDNDDQPIHSISLTLDGKYLATGNRNGSINIWNLETSDLLKSWQGHIGNVYALAIAPDGEKIISGGFDEELAIWKLTTGSLLNKFVGHDSWVGAIAIDVEGKNFVSGGQNNLIKVWNLPEEKLEREISTNSNSIRAIAITPDRKTIISSNYNNQIELWNLENGQLINTLIGHTATILSLAISPDGQTLYSGSEDNTIKVWDLKSGSLQATLQQHTASVTSLAINSIGNTLISGSEDRTIKIWQIP
jgi:WD40 repeat protein